MTGDPWENVVQTLLDDPEVGAAVARLAEARATYRLAVRELEANAAEAEAVGDAARAGAYAYALQQFAMPDDVP